MLKALFNTFFPQVCAACQAVLVREEHIVCTDCLHNLPVIQSQENAEKLIKQYFYGRIPLVHAAGLLYFQKEGLSQKIIHQLKYHNDERISAFLGAWLAQKIKEQPWTKTVDLVVPVPLHKTRKQKRGYNQVTGFGKALAEKFDCVFDEQILIKVFNSRTQVFKNRFARTELEGAYFTLNNKDDLYKKHVLLVDDIITTGTTLETCAKNLMKGKPGKISIATMAVNL